MYAIFISMRQKIAIYIDYSLRTPSFNRAFSALKEYLFSDNDNSFEIEDAETGPIRDFWQQEILKEDVAEFYGKATAEISDYELREKDLRKFFYNEDHYKKFIEDYSFNLFADCEAPCKRDIEYLNIAQTYLFDVVLVDEYLSTRKKQNTFFYLSKSRITPYSIIFLKEGEQLNADDYFGVWNPKKEFEHENGDGLGAFENWLKELETKLKNV